MEDQQRAEAFQKLKETPGYSKVSARLSWIFRIAGAVPGANFITLASDALNEVEAKGMQSALATYLAAVDEDLDAALRLVPDSSEEGLAILLGEVFGAELAAEIALKAPVSFQCMLNPNTVNDFQPFIDKGWVRLASTGSSCSMGACNRVGKHVEELKRPYGIGAGFTITVIIQD